MRRGSTKVWQHRNPFEVGSSNSCSRFTHGCAIITREPAPRQESCRTKAKKPGSPAGPHLTFGNTPRARRRSQMVGKSALALFFSLVLLVEGPLSAQLPQWDPSRLQVARAELEDLLQQYRDVVDSPGYSRGLREEANRAADRIEERLSLGDFRVGDAIVLRVEGHPDLPDTIVVENGPSLVLPQMGTISLLGILRSELQDYLTQEIGRYLRDPVVQASSMIRMAVEGGVGNVGFYSFRSDMLLSEALMAAGGLQSAELDKISLRRGSEVLAEGEAVQLALQEGRSLDQLNLRAGDRIVVPIQQPSRIWPEVIRWGVIIGTTSLLGYRIYR